ncbi:class II aldolase/adducin family protein [Mesorhizobium sp. CA8]|uniref:class II aldolase/adducin family protein n=1 Tax=unclassified Mesorhizobium TaxID=325217 RepID=UPI001CCDF9CB|nr:MULTISPECIES: class II aldolase/adducin family protein [unclassified Mesorhizobium]MBZ9761792.1 class II aldolase/adducin family protein [Mesorhizobium sp. CA8]MBZ9823296.1 class II aldolase/adducin family protein [Mesorhizobium sp. CA4]
MDQHTIASPPSASLDKDWWQLRSDLAAAHRIASAQELNEGIFNHLTAYSKSKPDRFLSLPFGQHWSEAAASELLEVGFDGSTLKGDGIVESTCYCIHVPIHRARPECAAVFHTHMPFATALTRLKDPSLKAIGQIEIGFLNDIAYDESYNGKATTLDEGERMARVLGQKNVLFLANHGIIVLGKTVAHAYERLYYLERACQTQIYAMWTGAELLHVRRDILELVNVPSGHDAGQMLFDAMKRVYLNPIKKRFDD